jgi:hypothetical protein
VESVGGLSLMADESWMSITSSAVLDASMTSGTTFGSAFVVMEYCIAERFSVDFRT